MNVGGGVVVLEIQVACWRLLCSSPASHCIVCELNEGVRYTLVVCWNKKLKTIERVDLWLLFIYKH